jgi:triosephosphate isomerase
MENLWVGTGWKMNHLISDAHEYVLMLNDYVHQNEIDLNIFICVPYTVINSVVRVLTESKIHIAAQNMHWLDRGPVTGEISPLMIKDAGASMVELGHSERRKFFSEDNESINLKIKAAHRHLLKPILCIGETQFEKSYHVSLETINTQLKIALKGLTPLEIQQSIIAYEPVWAIGNEGSPAEPEYVDNIHKHIKQTLHELTGEKASFIPVIYGGSVNLENTLSYISLEDVDGLFIGRSAWNVNDFIKIIDRIQSSL